MSTPSVIACHTEDGYLSIYCHNDGYPDHMLSMLKNNYNSPEKAQDLVSLGDASCIYERLVPSKDSGHSFDHPERGVCIFYTRDRGEPWTPNAPVLYMVKRQLLRQQYYVYVFENNQWTLYINGQEATDLADCE